MRISGFVLIIAANSIWHRLEEMRRLLRKRERIWRWVRGFEGVGWGGLERVWVICLGGRRSEVLYRGSAHAL